MATFFIRIIENNLLSLLKNAYFDKLSVLSLFLDKVY